MFDRFKTLIGVKPPVIRSDSQLPPGGYNDYVVGENAVVLNEKEKTP